MPCSVGRDDAAAKNLLGIVIAMPEAAVLCLNRCAEAAAVGISEVEALAAVAAAPRSVSCEEAAAKNPAPAEPRDYTAFISIVEVPIAVAAVPCTGDCGRDMAPAACGSRLGYILRTAECETFPW